MKRIGHLTLICATALLVWGTGFGGRSFGPVRFLLVTTPHGDKVGHFVLYGAIAFALAILFKRTTPALLGGATMCIVGIADEFRQRSIGGRNFDLNDIAANTAGICAGLVAAGVIVALAETSRDRPDTQPDLVSNVEILA